MANGDTIAQYMGPANPNAVPRKYVFHVYEQTAPINASMYSVSSPTERITFAANFGAFTMSAMLGPEVAVNFALIYTSVYTTWVFNTQLVSFGFPPVTCPGEQATTVTTAAVNANLDVPLEATIGAYPGYTGPAPNGSVVVFAAQGGYGSSITVVVYLEGLEPSATGGVHIHSGTSCANAGAVGGHYWTPTTNPDPWNIVMWNSTADGTATATFYVMTGYGYDDNLGHAVTIHNSTGGRVGCGVLESPLTMTPRVTFASLSPVAFSICDTNVTAPPVTTSLFSPWVASSYAATQQNRLPVVQARDEPILSFDGEPGALYTVLMVDDVFGATGEVGFAGNFLHWLLVNVDGMDARTGVTGEVAASYISPGNPDAMPHTYAFYVAEQRGPVNATAIANVYQNNRAFFNGLDLMNLANLGPIRGISFAQIFTDLYSNYLFANVYGLPPLPCPAQQVADATAAAAQWPGVGVAPTVGVLAQTAWATPASSYTVCGFTRSSPRTVATMIPMVGRSGAVASTVTTRMPPFVTFVNADPAKLYAVTIHDLDADVVHYMAVNVPGAAAATGVIGSGDPVVGYFPFANPNGFPHTYLIRVWEQSPATPVTAAGALQVLLAQPTAALLDLTGTVINATAVRNVNSSALDAVASALQLGPNVAVNWVNAFTSVFALAAFNEMGIGAALGANMTCPSVVAQVTSSNATWAGVIAPDQGAGMPLSSPLDVTFYDATTTFRTRMGNVTTASSVSNVYNGPPSVFTADGTSTLPVGSGWSVPVVAAPYVNASAYYTLAMVRQQPYGGNSTVLWALSNISGDDMAIGNLANVDTVWPYSGATGAPGVVSLWLFEQSDSQNASAGMQGIALGSAGAMTNLTAFMASRSLVRVAAMNFFSSIVASGTTCDASDGVQMTSDGRCVADCVAMLRMRRACTYCGTVTMALRMGDVAPAGTTSDQVAAAITTAVASHLAISPDSLATSVNGTSVIVVLPASESANLQSGIAQGAITVTVGGQIIPLMSASPPPASSSTTTAPSVATAAPVSSPPVVSNAPVTVAPTTVAPTTIAPTTLTPTTFAPTTLAPVLNPVAPGVPTSYAPTSLAPTTLQPVSFAPVSVAPTTIAPTPAARTSRGGESSGGGMSGGAVAAIVIVVLGVTGGAVYALLVWKEVLPRPGGGGNGRVSSRSKHNPYGAPSPQHTMVVSNPTYEPAGTSKNPESLA